MLITAVEKNQCVKKEMRLEKKQARYHDDSKPWLTLIKRFKELNVLELPLLNTPNGISEDKGKAVDMLLKKRFGEEWIKEEQLNIYFEILKEQITFEEQTDEAEQLCSCLKEETGSIH
ncbi:hypothetical protein ILUMI_05890 [Ignelater luminosus]|uniref:Uncharacterized protein n=1 Tax=Ignelater luminosus TaxID=2038154 RepID=A0A8K0DGS6_IGNLU|nr:hypothetical protein ILUMI_05890 [Ignelater luminosus]